MKKALAIHKRVNSEELSSDDRLSDNPAISLINERSKRGVLPPQALATEHVQAIPQRHELIAFLDWSKRILKNVTAALISTAKFLFKSLVAYLKRHPGHSVLFSLLIAVIALLVVTGSSIQRQITDQQMLDQIVSELVIASKHTRNFELIQTEVRGIREFMRVGAPEWSQREGIKAILEAAKEADLSLEHQAVLLATAEIESGFNPVARAATTSACGLFQFVKATGAKFGLDQADCMNPLLNARAGVMHYLDNYKKRVEPRIKGLQGSERISRMFELTYYLHHDGPLSKNPSNELKAIVLGGIPFLFRSKAILENAEKRRNEAPTFVNRFGRQLAHLIRDARSQKLRG
ncbi:MAG: transglycosylase SLT domain-containing protein [Bdellovibrionales bacterium]|nr:transglycosylase SLT domain-containing protein [Bdellovibrionales bacterium]